MSSRKRPLSELRNVQTPTRYAPSTPHAIHALQQRSGAKTRSVRRPRPRALSDSVRPDSARGILRRLAKITAPVTKKTISTPANAQGKENQTPRNGNTEDEAESLKRPRLGLDIDDSLDDVEPPVVGVEEDEDDSELPVAPTPSILPEEDEQGQGRDGTMTFKSIDFARGASLTSAVVDRRLSRPSFIGSDQLRDDGSDEDPTILTEMGRRAISEDPTGRLSRYSFGSLRMSDFGSELEIRRESIQRKQIETPSVHEGYSGMGPEYDHVDLGGETEHLEHLSRPSPSLPPPEESTMNIPALEDSFQLEVLDENVVSNHAQAAAAGIVVEREEVSQLDPPAELPGNEESPEGISATEPLPVQSSSRPRRKKVKLTRHGELVPSLPASLIKQVAVEAHTRLGIRKPKLGRDHMQALEQATEWFFEQLGDDLAAYSDHARRKKSVNRSDVMMLMRRQRVLQGDGELEKAVKELLPKEAAQELVSTQAVPDLDDTPE